jgi:hypothetical protein
MDNRSSRRGSILDHAAIVLSGLCIVHCLLLPAGIAILSIGGTVAHANYGILADTLLTIAGSIVLATSHYFNNRLTRHVPAG